MEYSDNAIATTEIFTKMAKEYNTRLKKEKLLYLDEINSQKTVVKEIIKILNSLIFLYDYIKRNIYSTTLKNLFLELEEECINDLNKIKSVYSFESKEKVNNTFKNFFSCIKTGISLESELARNLITLSQSENFNFLQTLIKKHLDFIKKLASI